MNTPHYALLYFLDTANLDEVQLVLKESQGLRSNEQDNQSPARAREQPVRPGGRPPAGPWGAGLGRAAGLSALAVDMQALQATQRTGSPQRLPFLG